jgi:hypothetical protein
VSEPLSLTEAADAIREVIPQFKTQTLRKACRDGRIGSYLVLGRYYIPRSEVARLTQLHGGK